MKLGLFLFAEYINMFVSSAVISALYFGGYNLPFQAALGLEGVWLAVLQFGFFLSKDRIFYFPFYVGSLGPYPDFVMTNYCIWVGKYYCHWQF
jgi:NADH:ubiquinone oxidoreductase subunit H